MQLTRSRRQQDLFYPLQRMRDQLSRFLDGPETLGEDLLTGWLPPVDLREEHDRLTVRAELPGMRKEDINVSIEENSLIISGEKRCEKENKGRDNYRSECFYGTFHRSVPLPFAVDKQKVTASYRDGVLTVELPKDEKAQARQIQVS